MDKQATIKITLASATRFDVDRRVFGEVLEGSEFLHVLKNKMTAKQITLLLESADVIENCIRQQLSTFLQGQASSTKVASRQAKIMDQFFS